MKTSSGKSSPNFMYGSSTESSGSKRICEGETGVGEAEGRGELNDRGAPVLVSVSGGICEGQI